MTKYINKRGGQIVVRRTHSLGDVLAATCVANALMEQGLQVHFQAHENSHPLLSRHATVRNYSGINGKTPHVNLDSAYESDPRRTKRHMADMYISKANEQLAKFGIRLPVMQNYAPRIKPNGVLKQSVMESLQDIPRPWIGIVPRSNCWLNRTVPDQAWSEAAESINGNCLWLGCHGIAPANMADFRCRTVDSLIESLACMDLVVTVDTGPMHIAAALGVPLIAIRQAVDPELRLSDQRDYSVIRSNLDCLNCQLGSCPISATHPPCQDIEPICISSAVNQRLSLSNGVSAVIAVYRPDISRLNRCLECVLPQVAEVVIAADMDTPWPMAGLKQDHKIKVVRKAALNTGYGKNANFGARHTAGKYIMQLNDDVFLEPNVIAHLREIMEQDASVAMVSHLLRYPEGPIQYAGKYRPAGARGFGHLDYRKLKSRYAGPVEQESICGASVLVRREAFYAVDGFDERYFLYAEDDDLAMKIRQAGWRIMFTPNVCGIHQEHQSTNLTPSWRGIMQHSNQLFAQKWKAYFDRNRNPNAIGVFQ